MATIVSLCRLKDFDIFHVFRKHRGDVWIFDHNLIFQSGVIMKEQCVVLFFGDLYRVN